MKQFTSYSVLFPASGKTNEIDGGLFSFLPTAYNLTTKQTIFMRLIRKFLHYKVWESFTT